MTYFINCLKVFKLPNAKTIARPKFIKFYMLFIYFIDNEY